MSKTKVMIAIPEDFLTEIDKIAEQENRSRTDLLNEAVSIYLKDRKEKSVPYRNVKIQNAIAIQDALAYQDTLKEWNSTDEIRKWRENR